MNIANHMVRAGLAHGERPAVPLADAALLTYQALAERVARIAGGLTVRLGLKPGDRVAITTGSVLPV